ncbi:hypothetical protein UFOVP255_43 [uncultured Caudovirales phage]|uniref:C1q domain containing protein n=1 Tax=uncultured Caudovirales phage TaxID=2100421 RepID=A0A6J5LI66_9CAUD|nr:hypothetical protein UFOVP255_43 [uncultured Caudovirales phage]
MTGVNNSADINGTKASTFGTSNGIVVYNGTVLTNYAGPQISSSGVYTNTSQPAFLAALTTQASSVTGNAGVYYLGTAGSGATTTYFDQGSNLSVISTVLTFTAPVAGKYFFNSSLLVGSVTSSMTQGYLAILLNNTANFGLSNYNVAAVRNTANQASLNGSILISMNANDTAALQCVVQNGSGNTANIYPSSSSGPVYYATFWSGYLVC